jgi:hypothetical protein
MINSGDTIIFTNCNGKEYEVIVSEYNANNKIKLNKYKALKLAKKYKIEIDNDNRWRLQ